MINWCRSSALLAMWLCFATPVLAQSDNLRLKEGEELPRAPVAEHAHDAISEILATDDFSRTKTVTRWKKKEKPEQQDTDESYPDWMISFAESMENAGDFFEGMALILKVLLWGLLAWIVVYLIRRYYGDVGRFIRNLNQDATPRELPTTLFGLDVKKTSLPKDVVARSREQWSQGDHRGAIATLLQASLIKLLHDHECTFYDSDTETECGQRIEAQSTKPLSDYMWSLIRLWQQVAYAHRVPSAAQFDQLCTGWQEVF
ncbi:hypothetical protein GCM10008090_08720 [Arenicella chitinivorans]|uniref:Protein-glutamine gamma-glutamyltransferase-like C-terminal domain-containing protein n=1 Tax=Arenicella chitinivorans TaxID=1329800 RepID=A0A918RN88_9GAMM|nr:DUF4129 domain-containing protein [Arenicella chitinivorans]GHA01791.1 hypothetical protein GCM10008090_08720 [Arenicella chitinivorans]